MFALTQVAVSSAMRAILAYDDACVVVLYARHTGVQLTSTDSLLIAVTVGLSI